MGKDDVWPHGAGIAVALLGLLATALALGYVGAMIGLLLAIWVGR